MADAQPPRAVLGFATGGERGGKYRDCPQNEHWTLTQGPMGDHERWCIGSSDSLHLVSHHRRMIRLVYFLLKRRMIRPKLRVPS